MNINSRVKRLREKLRVIYSREFIASSFFSFSRLLRPSNNLMIREFEGKSRETEKKEVFENVAFECTVRCSMLIDKNIF